MTDSRILAVGTGARPLSLRGVGGLKLPKSFQKTVKRQLSPADKGVMRGLGNASSHLRAIRDFVSSCTGHRQAHATRSTEQQTFRSRTSANDAHRVSQVSVCVLKESHSESPIFFP